MYAANVLWQASVKVLALSNLCSLVVDSHYMQPLYSPKYHSSLCLINVTSFEWTLLIRFSCLLMIREKTTRLQYYLQLQENLLHYHQAITEEKCFLLASYALQADFGNFTASYHGNAYFDPRNYFPSSVSGWSVLIYSFNSFTFNVSIRKGKACLLWCKSIMCFDIWCSLKFSISLLCISFIHIFRPVCRNKFLGLYLVHSFLTPLYFWKWQCFIICQTNSLLDLQPRQHCIFLMVALFLSVVFGPT